MSEAAHIAEILKRYRFPLSREKETQLRMAEAMTTEGISFEREVNLGDGDIIDFMIGGVGIEVKLKSPRMALLRQCERYCLHEAVKELILATNVATGWPRDVKGKPSYVVNLGRAWL